MCDDWIALINSIPGAVKAVTSLVGSAADFTTSWLYIGTSKAKQISGIIEAQTEVKKNNIKFDNQIEIAEKVAKLRYRAELYRLSVEEQKQENREQVVKSAIREIIQYKGESISDREPSTDWLNLFGAYAELASSDMMRKHWARILEGEIRKPGSFSFCTLHLASILDKSLAQKITNISKWVVEGRYLPHLRPLTDSPAYDDILDLASVGFLTISESLDYNNIAPDEIFELKMNKRKLILINKSNNNKVYSLPCFFLTIAGREILQIVPREEDPRLASIIIENLTQDGIEILVK